MGCDAGVPGRRAAPAELRGRVPNPLNLSGNAVVGSMQTKPSAPWGRLSTRASAGEGAHPQESAFSLLRKGTSMIEKATLQAQVERAAQQVRETCPMTPSITNSVTINFVANAQIAVGGSAAMVYLPDEGVAMAELGGAMYINVGTLMPIYTETLPATAQRLHELDKAWVVDPVAVGVGKMRTQLLADFKPYNSRPLPPTPRCAASIPPKRWTLPARPPLPWRATREVPSPCPARSTW